MIEKKSDSPDEDKCVHDSKLLIPTLKDFFAKHPLISPKTFLGDAAFDTVQLYKDLLTGDTFGNNRHFSQVYIPLNTRSHLENVDYTINEHGIPCCPNDDSLPMKLEGTKMRGTVKTFKFVCPKVKWIYDKHNKKYTGNVNAKILVLHPNVDVWCIFIQKKISVLIPAPFAVPKNGMIHRKFERLLNRT